MPSQGTHAYGYDAASRLTSASYPALPTESYTYDAVGNRTSSHRSASYSYQSFNRLTTTSTPTGLFISSTGNGFQLSVPADTNLKTLKLYVGAWYAQAKLDVTMNDGAWYDDWDKRLLIAKESHRVTVLQTCYGIL